MESGRFSPESPVDIADLRMRPPDRIFYQRLRPALAALSLTLWLIPAAVTVGACIVGGMTGRPWLPLPAVLLLLAGLAASWWHGRRSLPAQQLLDDARADELVARPDIHLPFGLAPSYGWAIVVSLVWLAFAWIPFAVEYPFRATIIAAGLTAAAALAWWLSLRRARPIGAVTRNGLQVGGKLYPWKSIATMRAELQRNTRQAHMRIALVDPHLAHELAKIGGVSSQSDDADFELLVPIHTRGEMPGVVYQVAHELARRDRLEEVRAFAKVEAEQLREKFAGDPEGARRAAHAGWEKFERENLAALARLDVARAKLQASGAEPPRHFASARGWARDDAPPVSKRAQWIGIGAMVASSAGAIFGFSASMFASAEWATVSGFVALGIAAALSAWALVRVLPRARPGKKFQSALLFVFLILSVTCPIAMYAVPDLYTRVAGHPFAEVADLSLELRDSERYCRYRIRGGMFEAGGSSRHYCAWYSEFSRLPVRGPMRIVGRESWFGRHVDRVEPAAAREHT